MSTWTDARDNIVAGLRSTWALVAQRQRDFLAGVGAGLLIWFVAWSLF